MNLKLPMMKHIGI